MKDVKYLKNTVQTSSLFFLRIFYQTFNQLMESSSKSLYEIFRKGYFFIEACHEIYDEVDKI